MWKEIIQKVDPACEFRDPASPSELARVEKVFGHKLPDSLRGLLLETNGVYHPSSYLDIIWDSDQIARRNNEMRQNKKFAKIYMTFQSLLFFADAGVDGIMFAFQVTASGTVQDGNIVVWDGIEDSRPVLAYSLEDYLTRWLDGRLKI